jgi:hypothetical protein
VPGEDGRRERLDDQRVGAAVDGPRHCPLVRAPLVDRADGDDEWIVVDRMMAKAAHHAEASAVAALVAADQEVDRAALEKRQAIGRLLRGDDVRETHPPQQLPDSTGQQLVSLADDNLDPREVQPIRHG